MYQRKLVKEEGFKFVKKSLISKTNWGQLRVIWRRENWFRCWKIQGGIYYYLCVLFIDLNTIVSLKLPLFHCLNDCMCWSKGSMNVYTNSEEWISMLQIWLRILYISTFCLFYFYLFIHQVIMHIIFKLFSILSLSLHEV